MSSILESRLDTVANHLRESAAVKQRTIECCTTSLLAAADLIAASFKNGGKLLLCGNGGSAADCQHMAAEFTSRLSADFPRPGLPAIALTTDTSFLTAYANDFGFDGVIARQVQALGKPGDVLLGISTSGRSKNVIRAFEVAMAMGMKTVALTGAGERRAGHRFEENWSPPVRTKDDGENENGEPVGGHRFEENWSPTVRSLAGCAPTSCSATPPGPPFLRGGMEGAALPPGGSDGNDESGRMPLLQYADVAICVPSDDTQHIQETHIAIEHIVCHLVERALVGNGGATGSGVRENSFGPCHASIAEL